MLKASTTAAYAKKVTAAAKKNSAEKLASEYYLISCQHVEGNTYRLTKICSFSSISELGCLRYLVRHIASNKDKEVLLRDHPWIKKFVDVSLLEGDDWKEKFNKKLDSWSHADRVGRMKTKIKEDTHLTWLLKTENTRSLFH
jgi:hypothetical protein